MSGRTPTERAFGQPSATRLAHAKQALLRGSMLVVSAFLSVALLEVALRLAVVGYFRGPKESYD